MRVFLDSNILTYIAFFEGYMIEGTWAEYEAAAKDWAAHQHAGPEGPLLREIEALHLLYLTDDQAHFDWLFSDVAVAEIGRIRDAGKRSQHRDLLVRLIEHRHDVYAEESRVVEPNALEIQLELLFPGLPARMKNDALQYCEALLVEADYFLTNDRPFANVVRRTKSRVPALKVSELPFIARILV